MILPPDPDPPPFDEAAAYRGARLNPGVFTALVLGRALSPFHRRTAAFSMRHLRWHKELHRGCGKTVEGCIHMAWHAGNDPTMRQVIVGSTEEEAEKSCVMAREIVEGPVFRRTFPGVRIRKDSNSKRSFRLEHGIAAQRDNSVESHGVGGRAGGRKDRIWFDDICDLQNSILKPAEREKVKEAVRNTWLPMLDYGGRDPETLSVWSTGTPWHTDDANAMFRQQHAATGTLLRLPCTGLVSPWPEAFTEAILAQQRAEMGPIGYARAYELVPLSADLLVFRPEWLLANLWRELPPSASIRRVIAAVDWAYSVKSAQKPDPDYSACQVAAIDGKGHAYALEVIRERVPLPVFRRMVDEMCQRNGVTTIYAEGNGPQDGAVQELREYCRIPVVGLQRTTDKHWRATEVQSFVAAGKYHLPAGADGGVRADFAAVFDEVAGFPAASHDDCLDTTIDLCREAMRAPVGAGGGIGASSGMANRLFVPRPVMGVQERTDRARG